MHKGDAADPKGLIADSFAIEGITLGACRTIFLDWALSLPDGADPADILPVLIARHEGKPQDHPMQQVLREGLSQQPRPHRRGGWSGRRDGRGA